MINASHSRFNGQSNARRIKRSEAPRPAQAGEDMVSSMVKAVAAQKSAVVGRATMGRKCSFFNQVCGYTPQTDTRYTGLNATVAPSSGRKIVAGSGSNDQDITSADTFTLNLIDQAVEMAKVGSNMVRPIRIGGQPKYVMYLHPLQPEVVN